MTLLTKKSVAVVSFVIVGTFIMNAVAGGQGDKARSGFDRSNLDESCEPCRDFYQYANGGWMKKNPIPPDEWRWSLVEILAKANEEKSRAILETAAANKNAAPGSNERIIGDLYGTCMDEAAIEAAGLKPLEPMLAEVRKLDDANAWEEILARPLQKGGKITIFSLLGNLSLPDPYSYLDQHKTWQETREKFIGHVARMFELMGDAPEKAAAQARTVLDIETKVQEAWVENNVSPPNENPKNKTVFGNIDKSERANIARRELVKRPIEDRRTYVRWRIVDAFARSFGVSLPKKLDEERFNYYGKHRKHEEKQLPRWRRCKKVVEETISDALVAQWVKKHYPIKAKTRLKAMIDELVATLRSELTKSSNPANEQGIKKLEAIKFYAGHPEKWHDYSTLKMNRSSYLGNLVRVAEFQASDALKNPDPVMEEQSMSWLSVGSYYDSKNSTVLIPVGVLQPPYFDLIADDAVNYGAIGAVVGHEIQHAFDYEEGDVWSLHDGPKYEELAACIERQFDEFESKGRQSLVGVRVRDQAIADLVGLRLAYNAWKKSFNGKPQPSVIDGFTAEQRFFLSFASIWAENTFDLPQGSHPPNRFRVNGTLSNLPEFAAAFGCKKGDAMVRETPCEVWW